MKIWKIMAVLLLLLCAFAWAETYSGTCGDNLTWELTDGALTISGTGEMKDFGYFWISPGCVSGEPAPWSCYRYDITSVTINDGVTSIGREAFEGCGNLTAVTIPDSVTSVGDRAFLRDIYINEIHVDTLEQWLSYDHGSSRLFLQDKRGTLYLGNKRIISKLIIPDGVTSVGDCAFAHCTSLTSVIIPESVTSVGGSAFSGCTWLKSVEIPDSVTEIDIYAFDGCSRLASITIPDSVTYIGVHAFHGCSSLETAVIGSGITSIGENTFSGCGSLTAVTLPKSVTSVDSNAFYNCVSLSTVNYGGSAADRANINICSDNTALMDAEWIYTCNNIHYCKNGVCAFCGQSFDLSGLDTLVLPGDLKAIGANALSGTVAQAIIVPDGCESIAGGAFEGFTGYISLPEGLEGGMPESAVVICRVS